MEHGGLASPSALLPLCFSHFQLLHSQISCRVNITLVQFHFNCVAYTEARKHRLKDVNQANAVDTEESDTKYGGKGFAEDFRQLPGSIMVCIVLLLMLVI
jgi:hypothetical protein